MNKYLIIEHWLNGTYMTDKIDTKDLVTIKNREMEHLINIEDATYYNAKKNEWVKIEGKKP